MVNTQPARIHHLLIDLAGPHKSALRTHDAALAARWVKESAALALAEGHMRRPVCLHFDPLHGDDHGLELLRSVHRIHADVRERADGSIEVRALYHYPDAEPGDESGPHPTMPLLTKRQGAKVPRIATRAHRIITPEAST